MRNYFLLQLASILFMLGVVGPVNASLTIIGTATNGGNHLALIFEGELNEQGLVWWDCTNTDHVWQEQVDWASGLDKSLTVNLYPSYTSTIDWSTGWRLPNTDESKVNMTGPWSTDVGWGDGRGWGGPDETGYHDYFQGYNMVNSELGHLYFVSLGNKSYVATDGSSPQPGYNLINNGPFNNFPYGYGYWSGSSYSPDTTRAWFLDLGWGQQIPLSKGTGGFHAIAVHPGVVSTVPVPGAVWLLGTGLSGLVALRRGKY